jgi:hypothetical protein
MGAVIDRRAFTRIRDHIEEARHAPRVRVVAGGGTDDSVGFFVQPTLLQADDPGYRTMCEEIFGPVLTVHVYPAAQWSETLALVDRTSPYALTGAVFSRDRAALRRELLCQRQADRRGRGPAAIRRGAGERDERQGGVDPQLVALGLAAEHQGDARAAEGLSLSVHGGGVGHPERSEGSGWWCE